MTRLAWGLCAAVMLLVIVLYAGMLPLAHWQGDEYFSAAAFRKSGALSFFAMRVSRWSPRPLSEALLTAFYAAVNRFDRPLSGSFSALMWLLLLLAGLSGLARRLTLPRLALALALPAAFLLGGHVTEVFYWPQGEAAYLTTLAALLALFWTLADGARVTAPGAIAALSAATLCSETGAVFGAAFILLLLPPLLARQLAAPHAWRLALPAAFSAWVLMELSRHRVGTAELPPVSGQYLHHAWPSLLAGGRTLAAQTLHGGLGAIGDGPGAGPLGLLVVGAAFAAGWSTSGLPAADPAAYPPRRGASPAARLPLLLLAAALLAMAYVSVAAAYYQFDSPCCERHETMRYAALLLAAACLGVCASAAWRRRRAAPVPANTVPANAIPALLLALLFGFLLVERLPALRAEYARIPAREQTRAALWASAAHPGATVVFQGAPNGPLVNGYAPPPGRFDSDPKGLWEIAGLRALFRVKTLVVLPP